MFWFCDEKNIKKIKRKILMDSENFSPKSNKKTSQGN